MVQEQRPPTVPIVEHGPTGDHPHPSTDGLPEDSEGHPGEHLEHKSIEDGGKVVAIPHEGHGQTLTTIPSEENVNQLLKQEAGKSGRWLGGFLKRWGEQKAA